MNHEERMLTISLEAADGSIYAVEPITITGDGWAKYETILSPTATDYSGRLAFRSGKPGTFYLDMVSLFPTETYKKRENGLRADIAALLADLKPKFMRFPGGCLVHDGSLNPNDRDSMYRWKNTIGPVENRPARRNNWKYNQTLGLGFFEYFLFCEDIGAKPLPVLPGGYDPHHQRIEPLESLQPWIDDALDLIEFANGDEHTTWGAKRAELGHPEPFNLEYIAIGNEEVGEPFFERYPYFHRAIREKYPYIKIINTASPFPAGTEYEKGWESARKYHSDLIDEHYYQSPEWFIANYHRYDGFKADEPKVFLGEYASWGNTWHNALIEAAYMTGLEKNAHAVGLACYAPLLCNTDYINWKPDLIWFNNHESYGTPNYYVQKLFMHHQGDFVLPVVTDEKAPCPIQPVHCPEIDGALYLGSNQAEVSYYDITVEDHVTGKTIKIPPFKTGRENRKELICDNAGGDFTIYLKAVKLGGSSDMTVYGGRGFELYFGYHNDDNCLFWEIGGWQNQDSLVYSKIKGRSSCLSHHLYTVETGVVYDIVLHIHNREIDCYINNDLVNYAEDKLPIPEMLYYSASADVKTGETIVKCVNIQPETVPLRIDLIGKNKRAGNVNIYQMAGFILNTENSFQNKTAVSPTESQMSLTGSGFDYIIPGESVTIFRIK
jgi:alpha-L-arabinofuranosidase